jgi:hypothetical protein
MLYCVIGKPKENRVLPRHEEFLRLVEREWEMVIDWQGRGKINECFGFADGSGGIIILDADSQREVEMKVEELPLYPHADWEIKELMTADHGLNSVRKKLDSLK